MEQIKFDHIYTKLYGQNFAELVKVEWVPEKSSLNKTFVEYDTEYIDSEGSSKHYEIPANTQLLVLTFIGDKKIPFTTVRKSTSQKAVRYQNSINKVFEIVVNGLDSDKFQTSLGL